MIKRFKHMLGIEGAKVKIYLDEDSHVHSGLLKGEVELSTLNPVTVVGIFLKLEERYQRGRQKRKLIDKYQIGQKAIPLKIELLPETPVRVPFEIECSPLESPIDEFANKNPINGALAWVAKQIKNAKSTFILTIEAEVEGTKLNPFDSQIVEAG